MALEAPNLDNLDGRKLNQINLPGFKEAGEIQAKNELSAEATQIREEILGKMTREKGVISKDEETEWRQSLTQAHLDTQDARQKKREFEDHWRRSMEIRAKLDKELTNAEAEAWLEEGERDEWVKSFTQKNLEQKQQSLEFSIKTIENRRNHFKKDLENVNKDVLKSKKKALDRAKNWKEKHEAGHEMEEITEELKEYSGALKEHPLGKDTVRQFLEWFIDQDRTTQKRALKDLQNPKDPNGVKPYIDTWKDFQKLPKKIQAKEKTGFLRMGHAEREATLSKIERTMERDYGKILRENKNAFSTKEVEAAEKAFDKNVNDRSKRLEYRTMLLEALPGHIKAAQKLVDAFEEYDEDTFTDLFKGKFYKADFKGKEKILNEEMPRDEKLFLAYSKQMSACDGHTITVFEPHFEAAKTLREKAQVVKDAEKFDKLMLKHFALREKNDDLFNSPASRSHERYTHDVNDLGNARDALRDLGDEIAERKTVHTKIDKLRSKGRAFLADRIETNAPFGKIKEQTDGILKIDKHYDLYIPHHINKAKQAEAENNESNALDEYLQALKFDPESQELQKLVAHLTQKGIKPSIEPYSELDEQATKAIMDDVEAMPEIDAIAYEEARKQLLTDAVRKHQSRVGATGSTIEARATAAKKSMTTEEATKATVIEEASKNTENTYVIDEEKTVRKEVKIDVTADTQLKETDDSLHAMEDNNVFAGAAKESGLAEIKLVGGDGQEKEAETVAKELTDNDEKLNEKVIELSTARMKKTKKLSEKQARKEAEKMQRLNRKNAIKRHKERIAS